MEIRTVLVKKKQIPMEEISEIEDNIIQNTEIIIPDSSDFMKSNELQKETLLYPFDCLILTMAKNLKTDLITFDSELKQHGAIEPKEIL